MQGRVEKHAILSGAPEGRGVEGSPARRMAAIGCDNDHCGPRASPSGIPFPSFYSVPFIRARRVASLIGRYVSSVPSTATTFSNEEQTISYFGCSVVSKMT